jgi:hypothetical protein
MDYSKGKASIDLIWRNTKNDGPGVDINGNDGTIAFPHKNSLDAGLTFGLGDNTAVQYRNFGAKSQPLTYMATDGSTFNQTLKLTTNEFNVLYKLDKNVAAFVGLVRAQTDYSASTSTPTASVSNSMDASATKTLSQLGIVASTVIADKTTLWGSVAVGSSSLTDWEIGASYGFAPNLEFDIDYREIKLDSGIADADSFNTAKAKGLGFGVTYKF